ncbi:MAG: amino acid adenylation domain-containing protein, partial [Lachnospiraceae bacterium]|nr:amino acid adenylation domain-containing protein [Lachnospiraceae bacterium]
MQASVTKWLDETAHRYPSKTALVDEEQKITYQDYRKNSIAIARAMIELGVGQQNPVVVYMEKSAKLVVSFIGIAYSRNVYSPIDVDMPGTRVDKILEVLQPKVVITTKELRLRFEQYQYKGKYLIYDDIIPQEDDELMVRSIMERIIDTDLLYVLFTSGSTGVPKGVGICHRSVIDYIEWVTEEFAITSDDSFGNQAPFYFDNSILDIYSSLRSGATLYIIPKKLFSQPVLLLEYIRENDINTIFWVPSALIAVAQLRALKNVDLTDTLKRVLFCGEVMPNKHLNFWRKYLPEAVYANLYGPTEITDACTYYKVERTFNDEDALPIGNPMRNTEVLLLDENNVLIPSSQKDVPGELCIKGTCLAIGYYRNPEKTKQAFIQNPLNDRYEEKIYRTGDLAAYNEYGELMYLGRKDYQIKHMGHRIELGEIETAASSLDDISRCCCLY